MKTKRVIEASRKLSRPYRITNGKKFRLKDIDPEDTGDLKAQDKPRAKEALQIGVQAFARTAGRSLRAGPVVAPFSSFKQWTRPEKTERSNMSCRA